MAPRKPQDEPDADERSPFVFPADDPIHAARRLGLAIPPHLRAAEVLAERFQPITAEDLTRRVYPIRWRQYQRQQREDALGAAALRDGDTGTRVLNPRPAVEDQLGYLRAAGLAQSTPGYWVPPAKSLWVPTAWVLSDSGRDLLAEIVEFVDAVHDRNGIGGAELRPAPDDAVVAAALARLRDGMNHPLSGRVILRLQAGASHRRHCTPAELIRDFPDWERLGAADAYRRLCKSGLAMLDSDPTPPAVRVAHGLTEFYVHLHLGRIVALSDTALRMLVTCPANGSGRARHKIADWAGRDTPNATASRTAALLREQGLVEMDQTGTFVRTSAGTQLVEAGVRLAGHSSRYYRAAIYSELRQALTHPTSLALIREVVSQERSGSGGLSAEAVVARMARYLRPDAQMPSVNGVQKGLRRLTDLGLLTTAQSGSGRSGRQQLLYRPSPAGLRVAERFALLPPLGRSAPVGLGY